MNGERYSDEENTLLLSDLQQAQNQVKRENFEALEAFWKDFWPERKRSAYALFLQTKRLATKANIDFVVVSIPRHIRNRRRSKETPKRFTKGQLFEQVRGVIQIEINRGIRRATSAVLQMMEKVAAENKELKEEVRRLKPYEGIVQKEYAKELEFRGGGKT